MKFANPIYHALCLLWMTRRSETTAAAFLPSPHGNLAGRFDRHAASNKHHTSGLLSIPRRDFVAAGTVALTTASSASTARAAAITASSGNTVVEPIADLPMIRLKLPKGGFGREYVAIKLKINGQGPFDFMLDTGLTTEFITPHLQQTLGISPRPGGSKIRGLAAGGESGANTIIELRGASLCCGKVPAGESDEGEFPLPALRAIITDFPQEHIDPAHDVEGMLGMEMLSLFDVDFDFPNGRVRFWKPGTAVKTVSGLVEIPAVVINETGLIGVRLLTPGVQQPVLAFLDCGSTFTAMNWSAASYLGLPPKEDAVYKKSPSILALGIDGHPIQLPTVSQELTFVGDITTDQKSGRPIGFAAPPTNWKPWKSVQLAIGDLPAFQTVLGDGITPYKGPAALLGLDILAQRRVILETGADRTRRRRLLVSPQ